MAVDRNALRIKARYCEVSNRYADMVEAVRELVTSLPEGDNLTPEERNLLAVAYKFEVGARRRSLRAIHKIHDTSKIDTWKRPILNERMTAIIKEQIALCKDLIGLLDKHLIPIVDEEESDIFYHKLKADYCRYLAEVEENQDKASELINTAKENYEGATGYAVEGLPATHPLRIGLAMNYSVFMHEMLHDTTKAHDHAKQYYDEALDELEGVRDVDEVRYNECARLLALMHENIKIWTVPTK